MDIYVQSIQKFINQIVIRSIFRHILIFSTVWCFLLGILVISIRIMGQSTDLLFYWAGLGFIPLIFLSFLLARKNLPSRREVLALIDRESHCNGLLMAKNEIDIGSWSSKMPPHPCIPEVRWQSKSYWNFFIWSGIFLAVSFLVPQKFIFNRSHPLDIHKEVKELSHKIEILKEESLLDSSEAKSLEKKLKELAKEAKGEDPVKTWEALDHIENIVKKAATEGQEKALQETEELSQAETLAQGIQKEGRRLSPKMLQEAMAELSGMIQKSAKKRKFLKKRISPQTLKACQKSKLTMGELQKALDAIRKSKGDIRKLLNKLQKAGLTDSKALQKCKELGKCSAEGLANFLEENSSQMTVSEMVQIWRRNQKTKPTKSAGGIQRGRGDAPMAFWDTPASKKGTRFKEKILPPSLIIDFKKSHRIGMSLGAPSSSPNIREKSGNLKVTSHRGSAFRQTILPCHRSAIQRYFQRK